MSQEHSGSTGGILGKLLIVDDDVTLSHELAEVLSEQSWKVELAHTISDGIQLLQNFSYDLILLDWNLPDGTGFDVCRKFRGEGKMTPIIFLTARGDIEAKEAALDAGADDYLAKPFEIRELLARVRSVARRPGVIQANVPKIGALQLDPRTRVAEHAGKSVQLTQTESGILALLMRGANNFFTGPQIFESVWPSQSDTADSTVRVHMKFLREKLNRIDAAHYVETVRGSGYIMRDVASD